MDPSVSTSRVLGLQVCTTMQPFVWVPGIKLRLSHLCGKHFADCVIFLASVNLPAKEKSARKFFRPSEAPS